MEKYDYAITPTMLNAYNRYMRNDDDESFESLFNTINNTKGELPENVLKGIHFEKMINEMIDGNAPELSADGNNYVFKGFEFNRQLSDRIFDKLKLCTTKQEKVSIIIPSHLGNIKLHGITDFGFPEMITDLKTTEVYKCNKYLKNTQHQMYSLIRVLKDLPMKCFKYLVTDFNKLYQETYIHNDKMHKNLLYNVYEFINFLNYYRDYITNPKIFGHEERSVIAAEAHSEIG